VYYRGDDPVDDYQTSSIEGTEFYTPPVIDPTLDKFRYEGRFALEKDQPSPYGSGLPSAAMVAALLFPPTALTSLKSLESVQRASDLAGRGQKIAEEVLRPIIAATITGGGATITEGGATSSLPSPALTTSSSPTPPTYFQIQPFNQPLLQTRSSPTPARRSRRALRRSPRVPRSLAASLRRLSPAQRESILEEAAQLLQQSTGL
jgi:hypothetical protein